MGQAKISNRALEIFFRACLRPVFQSDVLKLRLKHGIPKDGFENKLLIEKWVSFKKSSRQLCKYSNSRYTRQLNDYFLFSDDCVRILRKNNISEGSGIIELVRNFSLDKTLDFYNKNTDKNTA